MAVAGSPAPNPSGPTLLVVGDHSDEQRAIIEAPIDEWCFVTAGPGTGKTAVACARVAWLLAQGVSPSSILMVSFTRTAVAELRARIQRLSKANHAVAGVRITTLDSEAWHLGVGFEGSPVEQKLAEGFSKNIDGAVKLLKKGGGELTEWFKQFRHLLVDEGQDLVGNRAALVFELLGRLPEGCGATVFSDPAQAIYGFSSDQDEAHAATAGNAAPFHEELTRQFRGTPHQLTRLFRTNAPKLCAIFEQGRPQVLAPGDAKARLNRLESIAREHSGTKGKLEEEAFTSDELVLFRWRSEVLSASSFLSDKGVAHRLRLSQTELGVAQWVAHLLDGFEKQVLPRTEFDRRWMQLGAEVSFRQLGRDDVWSLLHRTAGAAGGIDLSRLRRVLSRPRAPAEFCQTEVGVLGPVLGTIHASKGREADTVSLMLPGWRPDELEEEVRVSYVGATRARRELLLGKAVGSKGFKGLGGPGGRLYKDGKKLQVELGRAGDVDALATVSRKLFPSKDACAKNQTLLKGFDGKPVSLKAWCGPKPDYSYLLALADKKDQLVGAFTQQVNHELFSIGFETRNSKKPNFRLQDDLRYLYLVSVRTAVVAEDSPCLSGLWEPWANQGFFLAPVVKGISVVFFPPKGT